MDAPRERPKLAHSTLFNLAGFLIPTIVQLGTVPIYIHAIGTERYGVMTLVWLLLGYFGIFDLGFGRAIANRVATLSFAPAKSREEVFWTGTCMSVLAGLVGGIILFIVAEVLFGRVFAVPKGLLSETKAALPLLILALPVVTGISALGGGLQGREAFGVFNLSQTAGSILYQVFPMLVAILISPALPGLIAGAIFGRIVTFVMLYAFCLREVPACPVPYIKRNHIRELLGFGGWVALSGLINPLLTVFDRFVIGAITGLSAVSAYTIPYNLVLRIGALPSALQNALYPRFAMTDKDKALQLFVAAVFGISGLLTPLLVIGMVLLKPFLTVWLGRHLAGETSSVGLILLIGLWAFTAAFIPGSYLQARNRPDVEPKLLMAEVFGYLPVLYWLTSKFGIDGSAWAWDARTIVNAVLIIGMAGILRRSMAIWIGFAFVAVTWVWVAEHKTHTLEYWIVCALLAAASVLWSIRIMPGEFWGPVVMRIGKFRKAVP